MIILDTSALILFFTGDNPEKMRTILTLIASGKELLVPDVVFPELDYVLRKHYHLPRCAVAKAYSFLLDCPTIAVTDQAHQAVQVYRETNLDCADSFIAAYAQGHTLATFDIPLEKTTGVTSYW